jgi:3-dehydroquinate dehydratase-2
MGPPLIEVLHGVNFDVLELREPGHYFGLSLAELEGRIAGYAQELGLVVSFLQSNREHVLIERLHEIARREHAGAEDAPAGVIINPGAWTHYAWSLHDALALVRAPAVEVHLSDLSAREAWRRVSVVGDLCVATVAGRGVEGYREALERLASLAGKPAGGTAQGDER